MRQAPPRPLQDVPLRAERIASTLSAASLVLLVAVIYGQTARHEFISYDDGIYLYKNPVVQAGLTRAGAAWACGVHANNWHPLTWVSHMLDVELFGLRAGGHHLVSAALHAANALLLFALVRAATGVLWPSLAVAALFAAHPLRVESVAWAAERKDVLSAFFGLLACGAYLRFARRPGPGRYLAVALLLALSLLAKPTFVTLPLLLLLLDWWPLGRAGRGADPARAGRLLLEKAPLFALAAATAAMTFYAQTVGVTSYVTPGLPLRLANALVAYGLYLRASFWPAQLAVLYPYPPEGHPLWLVLVSAAALAGISAIVVRSARRRPALAVGWLWYLAALLPMIGLVQVGGQTHADRYTYLPHVGLALALVWSARGVFPGNARWRGILAAVAVAALATAARAQTALWRSGVELFRHTAAVTRDNYVILNNLGLTLTAESRAEEAIPVLELALRVKPDYPNASYNLGLAYASSGRCREALTWFLRALRATPYDADTHYYVGLCLLDAARYREAADHFRRVLLLKPSHARARAQLAIALAGGGAPAR